MKSSGVVIKSLMWLFERMKTGRHIAQPAPTQRRLVLYVLDQDGNGLDDLNLDLDYLMNTEIFGSGYEEDEDEDEDDNSLLDELDEDEDDQDFDNDEEDLVN